ncbi:MAG: hypothetical protein AB1430_14485 [Pseudomonadota bacterium]
MSASRSHASHAPHELHLLHNPAVWLCALAAGFITATAQAATSPDDLSVPANADSMTPRQAYEHDKAFCNSGQATQPRALCLQEAARAYREARAGRLDTGTVAQADNSDTMGRASASGTSAARSDRH